MSVASLIYGGLVRFDSHLHVRPDGASRWTISRDGKVYTFYLRRNLRFADGRPVTAVDFVWALERALGPEGSAGTASFYLNLIAPRAPATRAVSGAAPGITALNPSTVQIRLTRPAAHFLSELAFPVSYVPEPMVVQRYGANWPDHAAGFGPFAVRIWRHSRSLQLVRNPYYYAGKPALRQIWLHFYSQRGNAVSAYERGAIDVVSGLQVGESPQRNPAGLRRVPGLALDYLAFNTARLPFYRLHARQAFSSVWSPTLATKTMAGVAFPARGFLPSTLGIAVPPFRPTGSPAAYLAAARYPHGRHFPGIALVLNRDAHLYALARQLQRAWRSALGLDITLRELNPSDFSKVLNAHAFDLALVRWGADYPDPQDFLGTQLGLSPDNVTGWSRRTYDRSVMTADSYNPNDPRRAWLFWQAANLAARKVPILPLDEPAQLAIVRPRLAGIALTPLGTITGTWVTIRYTG